MIKWLVDFDQTIAKTEDPVLNINFKDYEKNFLTQILHQFSAECERLDKLPFKNQERVLCCTVLYKTLSDILAEIRLIDSNSMLTTHFAPYLSMELVYLKLLKYYCGEDSKEKHHSSDNLLNKSSNRILTNVEWVLFNIEGTKLEWFKSKLVDYISQAGLPFKYYNTVVADNTTSRTILDPNMAPILYLSTYLNILMQRHRKKQGPEEKNVGESVVRNIPRVDMLAFYDDEIDSDHKMFMNTIEISQEIDYRNKIFNEKNTDQKVFTDRDMNGERVNLRQIIDKIEDRNYRHYIEEKAEYFKESKDTFYEKTYSQIVTSSLQPKKVTDEMLKVDCC